jgi:hypothetical protein
MNVCVEPSSHLLIPRGFGIGVGARAQHHHEQRGWPDLSGHRVLNRDLRASPVDETLLAGLVLLAQNHILLPEPSPVQLAESAVAITLRLRLPILFPGQLQS